MNASLSDGNESVIDIFILSANTPLSTQLEKQLRDEGYYVTLFSDGTHLLETLRNGKPNLLICDTTSSEADAFEVCRQIKADDYLWNIPVLILTGAADLGDLLRVLDCNADNFIAYPFDPPYLLSLIEGMLTVPVERQTPEQIKTQFKIKHDDQVYVVTADRRKLLEFLLSSFEIAVNKTTDLSRAQEDIRNLGFTIRQLEDRVSENTKVIGVINDTLKTKEQNLSELTGRLSDREQTILEKNAVIEQVSQDLSLEKSAHAEVRSEIQRIAEERDESLAADRSAIDQLQRQVSDLSLELATLKSALERANDDLLRESSQRKEAENKLSTTATRKDQVEKAIIALNTEYEQMKINFGTEKNRASAAEQELNAVLLAKTQSEQDLTGIINDLKATAKEQAAAIIRLREESESEYTRLQEEQESERTRFTKELESVQSRLQLAEENLQIVTSAKEQSEASLRATIDAAQKELISLQGRLDTAGSLLQEKEQAIKALTGEIAEVRSARESAEQELATATRVLGETNSALAGRKKDIVELEARLNTARSQVEEKEQAIKALTEEMAGIRSARESAEQELASVTRALSETNTDLDGRQKELVSLQGRLDAALSQVEEKEQAIKALTEEMAGIRSARESAEQELASVTRALSETNASLTGKQKELVSLQDHLETLTTLLDEKERAISALTDEVAAVSSARESSEQELATATRVLGETNSALAGRKKDIIELEARLNTARSQVEEKEQAISALTEKIGTISSARESLEQELASVNRALAETSSARETENQSIASQKEELARVYDEKKKAEALAESLSISLKEFRDQLEQEKVRFRDAEGRMNAMILERDQKIAELRQVHEETRTAFSSHKTSLEQMERDLDSAISARTDLEGQLQLAREQIQRIGKEMESVSAGREQEKHQLTSLADELERIKTNLKNETIRRQESEDHLRDTLSQQQQMEQDLDRLVSETKTLHADLTAERRKHEAAKVRNQSLEAQVTALSRQKREAERAAADLTAEIDHARVALADEWEDHMADPERLAAVVQKTSQPGPAPYIGVKKEAEIIKKRSLIVKVPSIPADIRPSRSMVSIDPVKTSEPETSHITSVEDLFEDDEEVGEKPAGKPVVAVIREPSTEPVRDVLPDSIPGHDEESFFEDEPLSAPCADTVDGNTADDENTITDNRNGQPVTGQGMAFDRTVWLDLLRWSHHCDALEPEQRMQIVRLGRLIQKGRKLTKKQEEQVLELTDLVQKLGYHFP